MNKIIYKGEHNGVKYEQLKHKNTWNIRFNDYVMNVLVPINEYDLKNLIDAINESNKILKRQ